MRLRDWPDIETWSDAKYDRLHPLHLKVVTSG
jgi:hypothetical protein